MAFIQITKEETRQWAFASNLERFARRLIEDSELLNHSEFSPMETIGREIALVLGHIERHHALNEVHRQSLLDEEVFTDTELMQMEDRMPRYSWERFPERVRLQERLFRIKEEQRRLEAIHQEKMQGLHDRLLVLVEKHRLIDVP